ncbi:hypothetical protein ACSET8_02615 [Pseudomonas aeruginosa]|uniref:hypothetical protein n=1 Tax=Pseudomonas aeruginosa TaxID=287 RepID=UPI001A2384CF|nr:hypothetical protein [Pseudomonas aeruginosa]MBH3499149.1 hypothetical protein [Pseudomonas aeruginosa]MBV5888759.1 hypothetical protein [Pseudomonas aeruginosa]MDA3430826.1 hypothetical protein [Pseudomonas aeruginosa]MDU0508414.1 hypothetical protein [Pseudomonas aeruginosa]HEJ5564190.1 hypothetical protein [Pseudomonas aeruginosa]
MAKALKIPYETAIQGIALEKHWTAGPFIEWVQSSLHNWPNTYKHRSILRVGDRLEEGLFVQLEYKEGTLGDVPERLYFGLHVGGARSLAIDEDGVTGHTNSVGLGRPFYKQRVGHPHVHLPVQEASYGYAEPITRAPVEELWQQFLQRANILGAPKLNLPDLLGRDGQMRLI